MKNLRQSGFTLYELLTTLVIVGIVLAVGVPNMAEFGRNSRMTAAANDLHGAFHFARSEASRTRAMVTLCSSTDGVACGGEFEDGWIVFADTDGDTIVDAGESILRVYPALENQIVINSGGNDDYFAFAGTGQGRGAVRATAPVGTLLFCDDRGARETPGGSTARVLVVTPLGRATVLRDHANQVMPVVAALGGC